MSVYHRIGGIDEVPISVFVPRMVRLPVYDGAVAFALRTEPSAAAHADPEPAVDVRPIGPQDSQSAMYGPMPDIGQAAVFEFG
jgi:hypothetical protein